MGIIFRKLKTAIKLIIAMLICKLVFLKNYKYHLLSSWQLKNKRTRIDNLLYPYVLSFWFQREYLIEKDPDKREMMKEILMGGEGGKEWAKYYDTPIDFEAKIGNLTYKEAAPLLPFLDDYLKKQIQPFLVVQIGSSSGKEIAWLAERNPLHTYIGTDICPEIILYSSQNHKLPNLTFEVYSCKDIMDLLSLFHQKIIVFSSGSLQYVQPEHLGMFFYSVSTIKGLEVVLEETASELPEKLEGSVWRGNFAWTHNYRFYAEKAGFITQQCKIIRPYLPYENFPTCHKDTVHYFYWGYKGDLTIQ